MSEVTVSPKDMFNTGKPVYAVFKSQSCLYTVRPKYLEAGSVKLQLKEVKPGSGDVKYFENAPTLKLSGLPTMKSPALIKVANKIPKGQEFAIAKWLPQCD